MTRVRTFLLISALLLGGALLTPDVALADGTPAQKAQLKRLKKENKRLHKELARKRQAMQKRFTEVTATEKSRGFAFPRSTAVLSPRTPSQYPARFQPVLRLDLHRAAARAVPNWSKTRTKVPWILHDMNPRADKLPAR
jgi:hypothetical protein